MSHSKHLFVKQKNWVNGIQTDGFVLHHHGVYFGLKIGGLATLIGYKNQTRKETYNKYLYTAFA